MSCGLSPNQILPRRYVVRAGVASPLTCRHPKHVHCACHGQPIEKPGSHTPTPRTPARDHKAADSAHAEALRQQEREYQEILADILKTIRRFPEAAAAVASMLKDTPPSTDPEPHYPDTGHA